MGNGRYAFWRHYHWAFYGGGKADEVTCLVTVVARWGFREFLILSWEARRDTLRLSFFPPFSFTFRLLLVFFLYNLDSIFCL